MNLKAEEMAFTTSGHFESTASCGWIPLKSTRTHLGKVSNPAIIFFQTYSQIRDNQGDSFLEHYGSDVSTSPDVFRSVSHRYSHMYLMRILVFFPQMCITYQMHMGIAPYVFPIGISHSYSHRYFP